MPVSRIADVIAEEFRDGATRRLVHTDHLMVVVIDFFNGPWPEPDPYHQHLHEQVTYIASGEILFLCEGEKDQMLQAGDLFTVPSNKAHTIRLLSKEARLIDSFTPIREDIAVSQQGATKKPEGR